MKPKPTSTLIAALALACFTIHAQPSKYTVTFLDDNSYFNEPNAAALNNIGQVVGTYISTLPGEEQKAFLYSNGEITELKIPAHVSSSGANGINSHGQIIGSFSNFRGESHAFLYSNGTIINIDNFSVSAINDLGQIAGGSGGNVTSSEKIAIFAQGKVTILDIFGAALNINNNCTGNSNGFADIVGVETTTSSNVPEAFLYSNGVITNIGAQMCPGAVSTAYSINDAKQIVGCCCAIDHCISASAFLYDAIKGDYTFIKMGNISCAHDINNSGQIVGTYFPNNTAAPLPFLYMNGESYNLFDFITPPNPDLIFDLAPEISINDVGQILANTNQGPVLLTPVQKN